MLYIPLNARKNWLLITKTIYLHSHHSIWSSLYLLFPTKITNNLITKEKKQLPYPVLEIH